MRRLLLLTVCFLTASVLFAGPVTKEQAQQQAQQFLQGRVAAGHNRAAANAHVDLSGEVSGLYVFNVAGDNGYVIVSNDDIAFPVLGYADSGSFDMNNIPENMKAWLQGYADEIAWAKSHGVKKASESSARRASGVKTPIAPLIETRWNQGSPYNNQTPYYGVKDGYYVYGETPGVDWKAGSANHCVTGCVATAMAQVMYYNQWPKAATTAIPSYKWSNAGVDLTGLSATTFDWANMKLTYSGSETDESATAVSALMKYCGYSVGMNYGPSSGASAARIANALKNYFGYNATTTYIKRSNYSYANWIEIMYNELLQNRPVLIGGQSSSSGHEFICDGYDNEDYFHINWGWAGLSDDYFKLSALDPDAQGIGGSSSTDGFRYEQDAVVGIQKSTGEGTTLDLASLKSNFSISIESVTFSDSPTQYEEVEVTVNVSNSGSDEFDGDLGIDVYYGAGSEPMYVEDAYANVVVPAGQTKPVKFTFVPENSGTYQVVFFSNGYYISSYYSTSVAAGGGGGGGGSSNPTTNNIDLTFSLVAENSELSGVPKTYSIWGKNFHGQLTVNNPSTTHDYDGFVQYNLYKKDGSMEPLGYKSTHVVIPANGNIVIPIEYNGLINGTQFEVDVVYQNTTKYGGWTDFDVVAYYNVNAGIVIYASDGTEIVTKPSGTSYTVSAGTSSVDLTDTGIITVTNASEPNCVFILDSDDMAPTGANIIVRYDGSAYTAGDITLTDGKGFYSPVDFTATKVEFTYNNDRWADGSNGWNTIMLPFNVTKVTANDVDIDWFHTSSDTGKHFWLKEFTSDAVGTVNFGFASSMTANTPYIVALPGNHWGSEYDLSSKTIKFIGEGVTVKKGGSQSPVTASNYRFVGNTVADATENIYGINAAGNSFVLGNGSAPFRAFFKSGTFDRTVTSLGIGSDTDGNTTGINDVQFEKNSDGQYYNLNGQRISQPKKGLYIKNGKKYIVK